MNRRLILLAATAILLPLSPAFGQRSDDDEPKRDRPDSDEAIVVTGARDAAADGLDTVSVLDTTTNTIARTIALEWSTYRHDRWRWDALGIVSFLALIAGAHYCGREKPRAGCEGRSMGDFPYPRSVMGAPSLSRRGSFWNSSSYTCLWSMPRWCRMVAVKSAGVIGLSLT